MIWKDCFSDKLQQLKSQLSSQQSLLFKGTAQAENSAKVSYLIEENITKCKKPFVDREFVLECLQCIVDII
jgi:hypothetical protein